MSGAEAGRRSRVRGSLRDPRNWAQLGRFALVGASGYVVNLAVFVLAERGLGLGYSVAAVVAFAVAVASNFLLNRRWTFRGHASPFGHQAARFFTVSVGVFVITWALLHALVAAGSDATLAQAISVACGTPLNFVANRIWTFSSARSTGVRA